MAIIQDAEETFEFSGEADLTICPKGNLWCAYTRRIKNDDNGEMEIWGSTPDVTGRWRNTTDSPRVISEDGFKCVMCVSLCKMNNEQFGMLFLKKISSSNTQILFDTCTDPSIPATSFSNPKPLNLIKVGNTPLPGYYVVENNRLIQLHHPTNNNRIIFPFAYTAFAGSTMVVYALYSDDYGSNWGVINEPIRLDQHPMGALEPSIVELSDGTLLMNIRTRDTGQISYLSTTAGNSWTRAENFNLKLSSDSTARFFKLANNSLIAFYNPIDGVRSHLSLALYNNETGWSHIKDIEPGFTQLNPNSNYTEFAYPSVIEQNGILLLTYYYEYFQDGPGMLIFNPLDINTIIPGYHQ